MAFRLIPQEVKFFDMFDQQAAKIVTAAAMLQRAGFNRKI